MEVEVKELFIEENGRRIYGRLYAPKDPGTYPAVIISHGYNGTNLDWAREGVFFAEHGIISYAYDFCGGSMRSRSSGKTTEMTMETEKKDVLSVLSFISDLPMVDSSNLFLMGGSMGGFASALAAEEASERVRGMILYYPALCIPDNWREKYPENAEIPETIDFWDMTIGKGYVEQARTIHTFDTIGRYPKKVVIFHGTEDLAVPIATSEKAAAHYPDAELVRLPGEGHGFLAPAAEKVMEEALGFMKTMSL